MSQADGVVTGWAKAAGLSATQIKDVKPLNGVYRSVQDAPQTLDQLDFDVVSSSDNNKIIAARQSFYENRVKAIFTDFKGLTGDALFCAISACITDGFNTEITAIQEVLDKAKKGAPTSAQSVKSELAANDEKYFTTCTEQCRSIG